jgi:glucose-6-phosphate 1-epimerase
LLQEVIDKFSIPGTLSFSENEHGLIYATVTNEACRGVVYFQGAHLAEWCPVGSEPILFLSEQSQFQPGNAIRGGVPIIFPWFGPRTANDKSTRTDGPSHGFARTSTWQLAEAGKVEGKMSLVFVLEPDENSRALGFDNFRLVYRIMFGKNLTLQLTVENKSGEPMHFEEALHTYFSVGDVQQVNIYGLLNAEYFDKTDNLQRKKQTENVLTLTGECDRAYIDTKAPVYVQDPLKKRRIVISKENSKSTVVWNPWTELTAKLADMQPDGWKQMVCVETANVMTNGLTLAPGEKHVMSVTIAVSKTA